MLDKLKTWVVEQVLWAEANMKGKTGAEKRAAVVSKLDDLIPLPWFLEWMDGPLIGWLVDQACAMLNEAHGHAWGEKGVTKEEQKELAEALEEVLPPKKMEGE